MAKLKNISRITIALSALLMIVSFFTPVWQILMWAPQYPEGLEMKIWLHTLTGDYKIISGLNHYIGMKHIETSMFPEFGYMRWIVAGLIVFGLATALLNRRFWLISYALLFVIVAATGLVDFYLWGYDYGHNLDPNAAIVVPGMAYQPPLIGTKQLLNFTAYSGPDIGGFIFLISGLAAVAMLIVELRAGKTARVIQTAVMLLLAVCCFACSTNPEPLNYGKDACHFCKMTLIDKRFGGELVTTKGKIFKFDDVSCMLNFIRSGEVPSNEVQHELIVDYANPGELINAANAALLYSPLIRSPMNGNYAAFSRSSVADQYNTTWKGEAVSWSKLNP